MCGWINMSSQMGEMFRQSILTGKNPEGKPWTKDSVEALHIFVSRNDMRALRHAFNTFQFYEMAREVDRREYAALEEQILIEMVADKMSNEIEEFSMAEFASLDESDDDEDDEILEDDDDEDGLELEDDEDDDVLHGDDPPEAALPSSLTDLLKVANTNRILEAA